MAKGDTIYVITSGEYSDYHICAVTTDRERAEFLKKWYWDCDDTNIEEFIDGDPPVPSNAALIPVWDISCKQSGAINHCYIDKYYEIDSCPDNKFHFYTPWLANSGDAKEVWFSASVATADQEQAIKIAKDMRAKMLAEKFGI